MKINLTLLHIKRALVWEGSGYPRNGTPMGVSFSVLAHLVMKRMTQFIMRLNLFLRVSYDLWRQWPLMG